MRNFLFRTIDHVFRIMGKVISEKQSWSEAFMAILPDRKGAELKEIHSEEKEVKSLEETDKTQSRGHECITDPTSTSDPHTT